MELTRSRMQASDAVQNSNIRSLQRKDPAISRILDTATHVVAYGYNKDNMAWEKKDVEGSLFVFERTAQPQFGFAIVNRQNPRDLMEVVSPDMKMKDADPYLYYRSPKGDIIGLWFYDPEERCRITSFLTSLNMPPRVQPSVPQPHITPTQPMAQPDLMSMLHRAASHAQTPSPRTTTPVSYGAPAGIPQHYTQPAPIITPSMSPVPYPDNPTRGPVGLGDAAGTALLQKLQQVRLGEDSNQEEQSHQGAQAIMQKVLTNATGAVARSTGRLNTPLGQPEGTNINAVKTYQMHGFVPTQARAPKKKVPMVLTREEFGPALIDMLK
eukprot:Ihof_evm5s41 gene=Ihof_evmTU5s41